jgi:hypothetical protein
MRCSSILSFRPARRLPREQVIALHQVGKREISKRYEGRHCLDTLTSQRGVALLQWQVLGVRQALENLSGLEEASFVGRDSNLIFEKFDDLAHVFELIEHLLVMAAALGDGSRGNKGCQFIIELHFSG